MPEPPRKFSRTVIALGLVSLFTDIASEMVYTQMPIFLKEVLHAPVLVIGLIEGIAESASSLLKVVSGWFSDRLGRRKPLAAVGYAFGALSKPLMALAGGWQTVLGLRVLDRIGKGLRTAPRDALITESTPKEHRGAAFGLHRTMDTTGAVLGPLLGLGFLSLFSGSTETKLRGLFVFAGVFGLVATLTILLAVPKETTPPPSNPKPLSKESFSLLLQWRTLPSTYRQFLWIALLFNIGNSSDAFLILRAQSLGFAPTELLWLYAAFNVVEAVFGIVAGRLSDRAGRLPLIITGYFVFACVYGGMAIAGNRATVVGLFLLYGVYYTLTQGVQKAFVADLASPNQRGTQIGAYHTVVGLVLLPASLIAGQLFSLNPSYPFYFGGVTALLSTLLLWRYSRVVAAQQP